MWSLLRKQGKEFRDSDETFQRKCEETKKKIREIEETHWREELLLGRASQVSYDLWKQKQDLAERSSEAKFEPEVIALPESAKIYQPKPQIEMPIPKLIEEQPKQGQAQWLDLKKILAVKRLSPCKSDAEWIYRMSRYDASRGPSLSVALKLDKKPELHKPFPWRAMPGLNGKLTLGFAHQASGHPELLYEKSKNLAEEIEEIDEMEATKSYLAKLRVKHASLIVGLTKAHNIAADRSREQREMRATWRQRDVYMRKLKYNYCEARRIRRKLKELDKESKKQEKYLNS